MKAEGHTSSVTTTRARRRARVTAGFAALALLLALFSTAAPARASDSSWLQKINDFRQANGLGPLAIDGNLDALSQQRADANAQSGRLEHTPSLSAGVTANWLKLGENVGVGQTEDQIFQAFLNSPPHRANLLDAAFTHIGIGEARSGNNMWVTHRFMKVGSSPAPSPSPSPAPAPAPAPVIVVTPTAAPNVVVQQQPTRATPQRSGSSSNANASSNGANKPATSNGTGGATGGAAAESGADTGAATATDAAQTESAPTVTATPDAAAVVNALRDLQQ